MKTLYTIERKLFKKLLKYQENSPLIHSLLHYRGRMIPEDLDEKINLAKSQVNSPAFSTNINVMCEVVLRLLVLMSIYKI